MSVSGSAQGVNILWAANCSKKRSRVALLRDRMHGVNHVLVPRRQESTTAESVQAEILRQRHDL